MPRKGTSRSWFAVSTLLVFMVLCADRAAAVTISPSPSTNGSYTVNWGVPFGCTYTNWDEWVWTAECVIGYEVDAGGSYQPAGAGPVSGKPPGTYTYELVYEYSILYYGIPGETWSYSLGGATVEVLSQEAAQLPAVWSLSDNERRAYLNYYAPVILKRAHERRANGGPSLFGLFPIGSWVNLPVVGPAVGPILDVSTLAAQYPMNGIDGDYGMDWITNFYFDGYRGEKPQVTGGTYTDLRMWEIRPTLYTAAIEFMSPEPNAPQGSKELVLIYYIYHAMDQEVGDEPDTEGCSVKFDPPFPSVSHCRDFFEDVRQGVGRPRKSIHDWERIEIHLKGVRHSPGNGEQVFRTVITQHKRDLVRSGIPGSGAQAHFMQEYVGNNTGKHLMVFQAQWASDVGDWKLSNLLDWNVPIDIEPHGQELRYVENDWETVRGQMYANDDARVYVTGEDSRVRFHYVFVPEGAAEAVATFSARTMDSTVSSRFASFAGQKPGDTVDWNVVRRLTYELQDLADIFPTYLRSLNQFVGPCPPNALPGVTPPPGPCNPNWKREPEDQDWNQARLFMTDPIRPENGIGEEMGTGLLELFNRSNDLADADEPANDHVETAAEGLFTKDWWWGCYHQLAETDWKKGGGFCGEMDNGVHFDSTTPIGRNRFIAAGGNPNLGSTIVRMQHDYFVHSTAAEDRVGIGYFLTTDWYTQARGGFDGRYVQLFDDRRPLRVLFDSPGEEYCAEWNFPANTTGYPISVVLAGAKAPYTLIWASNGETWEAQYPQGRDMFIPRDSDASLTVRAANGEEQFIQFYTGPVCVNPYGY
jgi:hypothetical protein